MTTQQIFSMFASAGLIIIAIVLVPVLLQIKRLSEKTETLVDALSQDVVPMCKTVAEAAAEIKTLAENINNKVERTDAVLETVQHSAESIQHTSKLLINSVAPLITNVGAFGAGIKAFSHFFSKTYRPK